MSKPIVDKRFIVNLKGKEFVTYEGLLDTAHQIGIKSIETELLQVPDDSNGNIAIAKAKVTTTDNQIFEEIGDAGPLSVNRMITPHTIRMAFTRAKARALRDLTNIGMTAIEELGGDDVVGSRPSRKMNKATTYKPSYITEKQLNLLFALSKEKKYTPENMTNYIKRNYSKNSSKELTVQEASEFIKFLEEM